MAPDLLAGADARVRCLSGLYGLLRPTDAIQPYRLCMGTKLAGAAPEAPRDLYAFWGERVAQALDADLDAQLEQAAAASAAAKKEEKKKGEKKKGEASQRVVVNAASQEYWKVVEGKLREDTRVVSVSFPGAPAVYAKQARGAVARFVAERGLSGPDGLRDFCGGGCEGSWSFDAGASSDDNFVFRRSAGKVAAAPKKAAAAAKTLSKAGAKKGEKAGGGAAEVKREEEEEAAAASAKAPSRTARGGSKRAAAPPSSVAVKAEPAKRARAGATRK